MNVLLDECVPVRLGRLLTAFRDYRPTTRLGWNQKWGSTWIGGQRIRRIITVDRQLSTQQDLTKFKIQVVLVRARTNRLEDIRPLCV